MKKIIVAALLATLLTGCGGGNVDYIKERADARWAGVGFAPVGYEGFQWSFGAGAYGRGCAWYILKKIPDNGITYTGFLRRWGSEIEVYNVSALDAIRP